MSDDERVKQLQKQLLNYFDGNKERVKNLAQGCQAIDFPIRENIDAIVSHPEQFALLITYSDLGILDKLAKTLTILKEK